MSNELSLPDGVTAEELAAALELLRKTRQPVRPAQPGRAQADEETIFVRGEGGAVFEMAPSRMTADMRRRMQMGRLRRVNPDGTPHRPYAPASDPTPADPGASALTGGRVPRPAKSAPKKDWVLYAVAELGLDEERALEMSRQELIDLPPDYDQHEPLEPPDEEPSDPGAELPGPSAPKAEWIAYVARRGLLSREEAANYTKADLIDLSS